MKKKPSMLTLEIRGFSPLARCGICGTLLIGFLVLFPVSRAATQKRTASSALPEWRLNVRTLGYIPPQLGHVEQEGWSQLSIESICFLERDAVVVSFVTREAPAALPRRGQTGESMQFRLHALFIDTKTGRVQTTREWPTASVRSRVLAAPGGKFVVLTPDQLLLYSADLSLMNKLDVSMGRESVKNDWHATISPGGRNLLLSYEPETDEGRFAGLSPSDYEAQLQELEIRLEWIDLDKLQTVERWSTTEKSSGGFGSPDVISDEGLVQRTKRGNGIDAPLYSWVVSIGRIPNGPWHLMCSPADSFCGPGQFVNDKTVLRTWVGVDNGTRLWVGLLSTTGELLFQQTFSKGEVPDTRTSEEEGLETGFVFSASGQKFALALAKIKGANRFLDIGGHASIDRIRVFDVPSRQWIYTLDAKAQYPKSISGMALSPDGSLLGLINQDGVLEMYRVPEPPNPRATQ